MRKTKVASAWPVAFISDISYEGPVCRPNRTADHWRVLFAPGRDIPIDMAGFAVHLCQVIAHPEADFDSASVSGFQESDFISVFTDKDTVECIGSSEEVCGCRLFFHPPWLHGCLNVL